VGIRCRIGIGVKTDCVPRFNYIITKEQKKGERRGGKNTEESKKGERRGGKKMSHQNYDE
jgi:hypothetical protein